MIQTHQKFGRVPADGCGAAVAAVESFGATVASTEGVVTDKNNNWNRCCWHFVKKVSDHLSKPSLHLVSSSDSAVTESSAKTRQKEKKL